MAPRDRLSVFSKLSMGSRGWADAGHCSLSLQNAKAEGARAKFGSIMMAREISPSAQPPIMIDGVDISSIGLHELRRKMAIIPQNPACFSGTVRSNIDPFDEYTDEEVWAALERCEMKTPVLQMIDNGVDNPSAALAAPVAEYGENLSQGQRQLLCLARAVLQQAKILILDEATSAVDYATDAKIQTMIRTVFAGCTILVIAHRITTVIDSDLILVMGDGKLLEAGSPKALLDQPSSAFRKIVDESGISDEAAA